MNVHLANTRSGASSAQERGERERFLNFIIWRGVKRYLEIGCLYGDTFFEVMHVMGPRAMGVALDLPRSERARVKLSEAFAAFGDNGGVGATLIEGSSHDPMILRQVRLLGPYDLILVDADHRYESVKLDWELYGTLAPIVAFHDIAAPEGHLSSKQPIGVPRLWNEIKHEYRNEEICTPGSCMGFGILYR